MRTLTILIIAAYILLLPACDPGSPIGDFKLLPEPEIVEFYGPSDLHPDSIKYYRLADGIPLPLPRNL